MYSEYKPRGFDYSVRVAADISADLQADATRKRKVAAKLKQQRNRAAKLELKKKEVKVATLERNHKREELGRIVVPKHVEQPIFRLPRLASLHLQCSAVCNNPCPYKDHGYFPPTETPLVSAFALSLKHKWEVRDEREQIVDRCDNKRMAGLKRYKKPVDELKRGNERVAAI
ncbi:hypothetical protein GGI17_006350 [Coemansia sp. S146]|nr:hypothetical protein GGI17_006350 [Coemansia sp. S146]